MKKTLILLLLILILFSGCSKENDLEQPVNLYYLKSDFAFGDSDALFEKVQVESAGISFKTILEQYFERTATETARSPFPAGTKMIRTEITADTLIILMNRNYGSLTDLDLTLANACLYLTCSELTGKNRIQILIDGTPPEENNGILLTPENIIFFDQQASLNTD